LQFSSARAVAAGAEAMSMFGFGGPSLEKQLLCVAPLLHLNHRQAPAPSNRSR